MAIAQAVGVDQGGNVSVTLSATDADGDPLKYYLTSLPTHGALSYINPLTKIETPIGSTDLNSKVIPGGLVIYTPNAAYVGSDHFGFRAFDGGLYSSPGDGHPDGLRGRDGRQRPDPDGES